MRDGEVDPIEVVDQYAEAEEKGNAPAAPGDLEVRVHCPD